MPGTSPISKGVSLTDTFSWEMIAVYTYQNVFCLPGLFFPFVEDTNTHRVVARGISGSGIV